MPRVWNKRDPNCPKDAVYIGRPSKWGNPYRIGRDGTREDVIAQYRNFLLYAVNLEEVRRELKGKDLVCWCKPAACHGDVLLDVANSIYQERGA